MSRGRRVTLPYLHTFRAKGRDYHYARVQGKRRRIRDAAGQPVAPGDPGFLAAYEATVAALKRETAKPARAEPATGTLGWLFEAWRRSRQFREYAEATRQLYEGIIDRDLQPFAAAPLREITPPRVVDIMDTAPNTRANQYLAVIGSAFRWGIERELADGPSPTRGVRKRKTPDTWRSWTDAELERFEAKAGGTPYLAFMLAYYTGQRKGDILAMRWSDVQGGYICITQRKTGKELAIPVHRRLRAALDAAPRNGLTILQRADGRPYTVSGFNAVWRRAAKRHGIGAPFHGLRKSAVEKLLEAGASTASAASITGQTLAMVEHYAARVNQKALARRGMDAWEGG